MNENKRIFVPESNQLSARFSAEEANFIEENYELIMGNTDKVPQARFIMNCITKAVSNIKPNVSKQEDLQLIKKLELSNNSLLEEIQKKDELILQYQKDIDELTKSINKKDEDIAGFNESLTKLEIEKSNIYQELTSKKLPENSVVLNLSKKEKFILKVICEKMELTEKQVLVDNLFIPLQRIGLHDFKVLRLKKEILTQIDNEPELNR